MLLSCRIPTRVLQYDVYGNGNDGRPIAYGDGTMVEYVDLLVEGEEASRRIKLDRSINGDRPPIGSTVEWDVELLRKGEVAHRGDGSAYAVQRDKWTLKSFKVVGKPA
jgi:hypothetical protein